MLGSDQLKNEEHRRWNRDHVRWLEELENWEKENHQINAALRQLENRLVHQIKRQAVASGKDERARPEPSLHTGQAGQQAG